ncbi:MAG: amidohydrolase family protein [Ktedonobacterales bacterium]
MDELWKAGLSPLRVLQMTTLNGAEFLGKTADMGTVEVGKIADLVLLDANPVESVAHPHAISGVVRSGHYYSSTDLEIVKSGIATARSVR